MVKNWLSRLEDIAVELGEIEGAEELAAELHLEITSLYSKILSGELREKKERAKDPHDVKKSFEEALATGEFKVYYQPKVNLKNYRIMGAEALCRWEKNGKIVQPDLFIPALEESQKIEKLDFYMLEEVCKFLKQRIEAGKSVVQISVNLSRVHIVKKDLLDRIISLIDLYSVPHSLIQIELTEGFAEVGIDELKDFILGLRDAGISTAVDDFGTGYSSLKLVSDLPWDVLKIDKSLLHEAERESSSEHRMLSHIIRMTKDLGMECIVEGVESPEEIMLLKQNDCYMAQGYYFDKPLKEVEFAAVLDKFK